MITLDHLGKRSCQHRRRSLHKIRVCIYIFLQQKKLFIWNLHYQYKLGDCKTYIVLVSLENTKSSAGIEGDRGLCSHRSRKSLNFQNQSRAELCRFILSIIKKKEKAGVGVGGGDKTNNQRNTLQNETPRGKKKEEKHLIFYFNERERSLQKNKIKSFQKALS